MGKREARNRREGHIQKGWRVRFRSQRSQIVLPVTISLKKCSMRKKQKYGIYQKLTKGSVNLFGCTPILRTFRLTVHA